MSNLWLQFRNYAALRQFVGTTTRNMFKIIHSALFGVCHQRMGWWCDIASVYVRGQQLINHCPLFLTGLNQRRIHFARKCASAAAASLLYKHALCLMAALKVGHKQCVKIGREHLRSEGPGLWLILTDVKKVSGFRAATEAEFSSARETCCEIVTRWLIALAALCTSCSWRTLENDHWEYSWKLIKII